jgi:hypothetical protein
LSDARRWLLSAVFEFAVIDVLPAFGVDAGRVGSDYGELPRLLIVAIEMLTAFSSAKEGIVYFDLHVPYSAKEPS